MSDYKIYKDFRNSGCIDYLRQLGMYHLRKPVNDGKDQILTGALSIGKHRQSHPSPFSN